MNFHRIGHYDNPFSPRSVGGNVADLEQAYRVVQKCRYSCQFYSTGSTFAVVCTPEPSSGLRISYYIDESRSIRLTMHGVADRSSPLLSLNPEEERALKPVSNVPK